MFKILRKIICYLNIFSIIVSSQNCYTSNDVMKNGLVSYKNKVYDIKNYIHPGGQKTLFLSSGKPLEDFFNMNDYKFHIKSASVTKDLDNIYIGELHDSCINKTNNNTINNNNNNNTINNNNNTNNNDNEINNIILFNNSNIFYTILTFSLFSLLLITNFILNFFKSNCLNRSINLYCFGFISTDIFLFYIIYILWWSSLLILSFFSNEILNRMGIWICLNIAFTLLPITRNSLWIALLKISYNKLINIHKLIAVLCLLSVIIKIITILLLYNYTYLYKNISNLSGTICSISIFLTVFFSIPYIRKNIFELFYYSHKILSILTIISLSFHYIICLYYVTPSILLYIADLIFRSLNTKKILYANIQTYNFKDGTNYNLINLTLEKNIKINPGSYFFICCDNISKIQWHPLSLVSQEDNNLVFCIKNMGENSWSNKLKYLENVKYEKNNIYLQGPYYHINFKNKYQKYNYEYIINIANGIGITPFLSILKDINSIMENKKYNLKKVIFIWIIPEITFITPFIDHLKNLNNIEIQIFLTKVPYNDEITINFCKIFNKKPNIVENISEFIKNKNIKKTCILFCGSEPLLKDVNTASSNFGIEIFNETFN